MQRQCERVIDHSELTRPACGFLIYREKKNEVIEKTTFVEFNTNLPKAKKIAIQEN